MEDTGSFRTDSELALWWGTSVECAGTLGRIQREGRLAAFFWRDGYPGGASFVCLDRQLRQTASLEDFRVLPYADEIHEAVLGVEGGYVLHDRPNCPYG